MLDVQRVREDDGLLVLDALLVVEIAHHLHKVQRVARVLAHAAEDLRVRLARRPLAAVLERGVDRSLGLCLAGRVGLDRRGSSRCCRGHGADAGGRVVWDLFSEGFEEDGSAECVGQSDTEDLLGAG